MMLIYSLYAIQNDFPRSIKKRTSTVIFAFCSIMTQTKCYNPTNFDHFVLENLLWI